MFTYDTDDNRLSTEFSDYLLDYFETPLPLKEDGTIEIRTRNAIKKTALPLLASDIASLYPDAEVIQDGASIFINFTIPPRGDNPELTFSWELKSTIKKVV